MQKLLLHFEWDQGYPDKITHQNHDVLYFLENRNENNSFQDFTSNKTETDYQNKEISIVSRVTSIMQICQ